MEQIGWTSIVLSVLTLLGGCGWLIDRKKHRQEIESLKADNRQKDMNRRTSERRGQAGLDYPEREGGNAKRNLSRDYVTEWRTYIAEPLTIVDLCRDSAKLMRAWLCARSSRLTLSTSVATRQRLKASFHLCSRCSIGCSGRWGSSGTR